MSSSKIEKFRNTVWEYYRLHGRHDLPWRQTNDPYRILVSEIMLQQTQVSRVITKYEEFLRTFPTVQALAKATFPDVLKIWNGLGYNRRAKYLHDAAVSIVGEHRGMFPREYPGLRSIPGIGQYTANAVRVFAFDEPEVLIETNVRTAIIHHFFPMKEDVEDYSIEKMAAAAAVEQDPREWHSALFDYGAHLKQTGVRNNSHSAHYTKQSPFEGSLRQVRGAVLRELQQGPSLLNKLSFDKKRMNAALASLARDGLIVKERGKWRIT